MNTRLQQAASAGVLFATLAVGVSVVYRTFFKEDRPVAAISNAPSESPYWAELLHLGHPFSGDAGAKVTIVEISDLECPYCRRMQPMLDSIVEERTSVRVVFVNFPLPFHRFAMPAAKAAECAAEIGQLRSWVEAVFRNQDSLGLKSWGSFAVDAAIQDSAAIHRCATNADPVFKIDSAIALGQRMNIAGTPTILVNGLRFPRVPTRSDLTSLVDSILRVGARE